MPAVLLVIEGVGVVRFVVLLELRQGDSHGGEGQCDDPVAQLLQNLLVPTHELARL